MDASLSFRTNRKATKTTSLVCQILNLSLLSLPQKVTDISNLGFEVYSGNPTIAKIADKDKVDDFTTVFYSIHKSWHDTALYRLKLKPILP